MGWSDVERKRHLHRVLCLNRLLIRGSCRNLASYVLGQVLRRVGADFEACYGYRPWIIETFVDAERTSSCFKATNFRYIGQTSGKKRHPEDEPRTPKAVFVYELDPDWRKKAAGAYGQHAAGTAAGRGTLGVGVRGIWRSTFGRSQIAGTIGEDRRHAQ